MNRQKVEKRVGRHRGGPPGKALPRCLSELSIPRSQPNSFWHLPHPSLLLPSPIHRQSLFKENTGVFWVMLERSRNQTGVLGDSYLKKVCAGAWTHSDHPLCSTPQRGGSDFNKRMTDLILLPSPQLTAGPNGFWPFPSRHTVFKITSCMHVCLCVYCICIAH